MRIAIVGAGIMGRLLAFVLMREGYEIDLFDKDNKSGTESCSWVAAGLLHPTIELQHAAFIIYQLGREAIQNHWPMILMQCKAPIYFKQNGSIWVASQQDAKGLARYINIINSKLIKNDIHQISHKMLNEEEQRVIEPELNQFAQVHYFPEEAHIDAQAVFQALHHSLIHTIRWHTEHNVAVIENNTLKIKGKLHSFDLVLDCRGMGAKSALKDLYSMRGELIWLHATEVKINRPIRFLHPRYALYIVPRPNQYYLIGATEILSEDQSTISVKSALELLTAAYAIHHGFSEARIVKMVTQCRPTLDSFLPKIRYAASHMHINGLYRHGYLIAPTIAAEVVRWIKGGITNLRYPTLWEKLA